MFSFFDMTNKMRMERTAKVGGKYVMHYTHLHEGRWVKSCKEGMSGWEDEWMGTRNKKRWADGHKCMKRWVDECDMIKQKPQESLIQN